MRIITALGNGLVLLWFAWAVAVLFSAVSGGTLQLLPIWLGIVGLVLGGGSGSRRYGSPYTLSLVSEVLGRSLASKSCPACGQSVFDQTPANGYAPEAAAFGWWPSRHCANCGHDLKQR